MDKKYLYWAGAAFLLWWFLDHKRGKDEARGCTQPIVTAAANLP